LKAKRRISFKGKAFETGGESFNLEKCFSKSYSYTFDYLQKDFEKKFQKEFAKTKQVVQAWSKMLNKRNQPCISSKSIYWFNSKQPLHLPYTN
jgi:hypothetical protein